MGLFYIAGELRAILILMLLRHQPQLWLFSDPAADAEVFAVGVFQVFKVLLERIGVELCQKLRLDAGIEAADVINQLTFAHGVFTFDQ